MHLVEQWNILKNKTKNKSKLQPGHVDKLFEVHENNEKDEQGDIPVIIKPIVEEKKKKKSINSE